MASEFDNELTAIIKEVERVYRVKRSKYTEVTEALDKALLQEAYDEVIQIRRINNAGK